MRNQIKTVFPLVYIIGFLGMIGFAVYTFLTTGMPTKNLSFLLTLLVVAALVTFARNFKLFDRYIKGTKVYDACKYLHDFFNRPAFFYPKLILFVIWFTWFISEIVIPMMKRNSSLE